MKIHSVRDRFFPLHVLPLLRFGSQQQQMPDKHIFLPRLSSVQPGHFFSSTCHKTRETTMSVRLWTDVRRIVMIGTFLWTHHVFVCLFSFLLLLLLKNNINARHGGGDYIGERLCVSSWPPIFLSIFLKKKKIMPKKSFHSSEFFDLLFLSADIILLFFSLLNILPPPLFVLFLFIFFFFSNYVFIGVVFVGFFLRARRYILVSYRIVTINRRQRDWFDPDRPLTLALYALVKRRKEHSTA